MRIRQVDVFPLRIPYRASFRIARGQVGGVGKGRTAVIVRVMDDDGRIGWGEGSPSHLWSSETLESVVACLRRYFTPAVIGCPVHDIAGLHRIMERAIGPAFSAGNPIAKCALDTALHDLAGKALGVPIGQLWGYGGGEGYEATLSWTVSARDLAEAERALEDGLMRGYTHANIKLGTDDRFDLALCELVRRKLPDGFLWGDANGGYTYAQALRLIPELESAGLDLLEQPLPSNQLRDWRALKSRLRIPLAVDEPIVSPRDLSEWLLQDLITAFVIKPTRNGGLFPSRICAEMAQASAVMSVCSGLTETGVGLAAGLHVAAAMGVHTPCAWNGPQFLADDVLSAPLQIANGKVVLPPGPGLGIEVDEEKLKFYACEG